MFLERISINNFKNLNERSFNFSPALNCLTGMNGSGKTNVLDAIFHLSMTKSFFNNPDSQSIAYDSANCFISGQYARTDGTKELVSFLLERSGNKVIKRNSKVYKKFSDHIGVIPIVMVSPYDTSLINDSGEERRRFLNHIISQIDIEYLRRLQNYNQLLFQRNRYLKSDSLNYDLLDTYTERLSSNAAYIHQKRGEFISALLPMVKEYYFKLSGGKEEVEIEYSSELKNNSLSELLLINREKERVLKYTPVGIQRDDLLFFMNGNKIKQVGSQGQQKSFLLSLKLAQYEIMKLMYHKEPILLLDDVFDKLDISRVERLLKVVSSENFGQIFITDSNKIRVKELLTSLNKESSLIELNS